jgi:superfamily I DNA/RNA helicase
VEHPDSDLRTPRATDLTYDELRADRDRHVKRIVESSSHRRLIIAGPGTGKTTTFKVALSGNPDDNLVLTFIRNLRADLETDLGGRAKVRTLHGYADRVLHEVGAQGLTTKFHYYPPLPSLLEAEMILLTGDAARPQRDLEKALHNLEEDNPHLEAFLKAASYYDAVGHVDAVYRLVHRLGKPTAPIPKHRLLIVDEVQDLSQVEMALIDILTQESPLLAAGDDDQALYGFKHASPEFIRAMANDGAYETFELPYCSRCPPVIVRTVVQVIEQSVKNGNLKGRLKKRYEPFLPDKEEDGKKYPKLKRVYISSERKSLGYAGRYVRQQVEAIGADEIAESYQKGYPTVLVIGPARFTNGIAEVLEIAGHQVGRRSADKSLGPEALDGYRMLSNDESDRLGWRIIVHCDRLPKLSDLLAQAMAGSEFVNLLPEGYRNRHLGIARLLNKVKGGGDLSSEEAEQLIAGVGGLGFDEIKRALGVLEASPPALDTKRPKILVTEYVSAKGLSAAHVFVTGLNDGHMPYKPGNPTDDEICQFLVALTRTRKQCHLLHCGQYGNGFLKPSVFLRILDPALVERVNVDKHYVAALPP